MAARDQYDGFRLIVHRDGGRVRLLTRNGHNWSTRYPWIVENSLRNRTKQFVIDGEAVVLGVDGVSDFEALYSHQHDDEVQLYAFDLLAAADGDVLRHLPLSMRKTNLARLLARRPDGIFCAVRAGRDRARPVPCRRKNPNSPAMRRAGEIDWSRRDRAAAENRLRRDARHGRPVAC